MINRQFFKKFRSVISFILIAAMLNMISGCYYFKIKKEIPTSNGITIQKERSKYFIIHYNDEAWYLENPSVDQDILSGNLKDLPAEHKLYQRKDHSRRYIESKGERVVIQEVHLYTNQKPDLTDQTKISIPINSLTLLEIYENDSATATATFVLGTIGVLALGFIILTIIVALTKSSCPFVYAYDGKNFNFQGEAYGGAIYSSLERDDIMPLSEINSIDGKYTIKISNELKERDYTDLANLIIVDHPSDVGVLPDRNGKFHSFTSLQSFTRCLSSSRNDFSKVIAKRDSSIYAFNDAPEKLVNEIELSFKKPESCRNGKLIVKAKNTLWLDYVYGKFKSLFGSYYSKWVEKQKDVPAEVNIKWELDQGIPLMVYLKTDSGYKFIDYFNVTGPLAFREMIMPIDLSDIKDDEVKLKLSCGYMFWEIDFVAMDFTENISLQVQELQPLKAQQLSGNDCSRQLSFTDHNYLIQNLGDQVTLDYQLKGKEKGDSHSLFFHSRGYYEHVRDYKGFPNLPALKKLKEPGGFIRFSMEKLGELKKENLIVKAL